MSVLIGDSTKAIFQGFTGSQATMHAEQCINYGTDIVGGVTPEKVVSFILISRYLIVLRKLVMKHKLIHLLFLCLLGSPNQQLLKLLRME